MAKINYKDIDLVKRKVNIVDLANEYFSTRKHGHYLTIENAYGIDGDYSSVVIYPESNSFFRNSTQRGGDVISFVQELRINNIDNFNDAVNFLKSKVNPDFEFNLSKKTSKKDMKKLLPNERHKLMLETNKSLRDNLVRDDNNKYVIAYLINDRKIDKNIVYQELANDRITQAITPNGSKAVAFIGYRREVALGQDGKQQPLMSGVSLRSMKRGSTFKGDLKGCDYNVGWVLRPNFKNNYDLGETSDIDTKSNIYVFEGYIDMLSYMTIAKEEGKNLSNDMLICCGSANKYRCVLPYVKEPTFNGDVVVCFDNDKAGRELGNKLIQEIKKEVPTTNVIKDISQTKDWNDDLKARHPDAPSQNLASRKQAAITKSKEQTKNNNSHSLDGHIR